MDPSHQQRHKKSKRSEKQGEGGESKSIFRRMKKRKNKKSGNLIDTPQVLSGGPLQTLPTIEREGDANSMVAQAMGQAVLWKQVEDAEYVKELLNEEIPPPDEQADSDYAFSLQIQMDDEEDLVPSFWSHLIY